MPWITKDVLTMKEEFIDKYLSKKFTITGLCLEYNISRPTAYKWINSYKEHGIDGLLEQSRRPKSSPNRTSGEDTELILQIQNEHSVWGGRKLRQRLINQGHNADELPSESTINRILKKNGKIDPAESEKRQHFIRFEKEKPNELWQMDFKGHVPMGKKRCHPLTVLDDYSRYSIVLKACEGETHDIVRTSLEEAFREYGLPEAMTMDNGSPWKGSPPWTLSRLTVWLMRLGIKIGHSSVRHPQTQGKDERFHRTLKHEVLKFHQFVSLEETQRVLDDWRKVYNYIRPHEGIGLLCPYQRYQTSNRAYPTKLPSIEYESEDIVRKVQACGCISYIDKKYFVGEHLRGEYVAIRATSRERVLSVYYVNTKVLSIKIKTTRSKPNRK